MEYYLFLESEDGLEKLIASSPSIKIMKQSADRMIGRTVAGKQVIAARIYAGRGDALVYSKKIN